mmetsp:Transcript_6720/g.16718  ORF Transcript_6720/g.16718 Transcript_6720/m.16718 type:complete len:324 (+) Transcript_6720:86-1057(+)
MEADELECLAYAVAEIEALAAAYGDGLQLAALESAQLQRARALCGLESCDAEENSSSFVTGFTTLALHDAAENATHGGALGDLSGTCTVPDVKLSGQPVALRFQLPGTYPLYAAANLSVICSAPRALHDQLTQAVTSCAQRELGGCCLLTAIQELQDAAEKLAAVSAASGADAARDAAASGAGHAASQRDAAASITRQLIWFHHIKSLQKRKTIMEAARKLRLGGGCKPGFPGIIVTEGLTDDVEEFTSQIRALSWQAMQVRGKESEPLQASGSDPAALATALAAARQLPASFVEFEEAGMSDLAAMCRQAGLDALFATALKL